MKKAPNIYSLDELRRTLDQGCYTALPNGRWAPARPLGLYSLPTRLKAAWMVFRGKGDVIVWPEDQV